MKRLFLAGAAVLVFFVILFAVLPSYSGDNQGQQNINQVCFGSKCFTVELALTPEQQSQGLMYRTQLDQDKGMLFVFSQDGVYPFWMKNTLIPLDIIWMDSNRTVVFIAENSQPCGSGSCPSINPGKPAKYVLEVNGGVSDRIGLKEGDKAGFEF